MKGEINWVDLSNIMSSFKSSWFSPPRTSFLSNRNNSPRVSHHRLSLFSKYNSFEEGSLSSSHGSSHLQSILQGLALELNLTMEQ